MKRIKLSIELSDDECQELVSWIAEKLIESGDRKVQVVINDKVIVDQASIMKGYERKVKSIIEVHTGYTLESEGLTKDDGSMECWPYNDHEF